MGGVTVGPRQFTLMCSGTQMANGAFSAFHSSGWQATGIAAGFGYYFQSKVDLRGLLVDGKNRGLNPLSVILQEAAPVEFATEDTYCMVYDILSTVQLDEQLIERIYETYSTPGDVPGFLDPRVATPTGTESFQDLNPSQVMWGLWRQFGGNGMFRFQPTEFATQVINSGYFGQGEVAVAPEIWWTRLVRTFADGDTVIMPSANLVLHADAIAMTEAQELTQMMRAVQR